MKALAVTTGQKNSAHLIDVPKPQPGPNQALVKVLYVGVDATDHEINEGLYGQAPTGENFLILGHESLGQVEKVGPAGAVDILQADVTRCLGVTGWLQAAALAHSFAIPFSAHTAPSIHAQVGCAAPQLSHVEYFHDHVRIEQMFFDGAPQPTDGSLRPDPSRPGLGLELKRKDAEKWRTQ